MFVHRYSEAELADRQFRKTIPPKWEPYYIILSWGRAIGYRRTPKCSGRWVARIRVAAPTGCPYREVSMGVADDGRAATGKKILSFEQAKAKALQWFDSPELIPIRVPARPFGWQSELSVCPIGDRYTVAHAMRDFCEWKKEFRARQNFHASVSRANVYTIPLLGGIPCDELTPQQCRSLLLYIESSVLHRAGGTRLTQVDPRTLDPEVRRKRRVTANQTFTDLRAALNFAFGEGKIASNMAWRHVKLFRSVNRIRTDILTWEQARKMVQLANPELQRLILAALYTGCRITELFQMRVGDINGSRAAIYITPVKCYRGRTIALPDEGYEFFKALAYGHDNDSPLIRRNKGWPWTVGYVRSHFHKLCAQMGLPRTFVFHSLRHTYASLLLKAGTPPIVVARQLGHLNMATTLRTYAHVTDDFMDVEFRSRFKPGFLTAPDLFADAVQE